MFKELGPGLRLTIAFTILTGFIYPVVMTGISEAIFPHQANGSIIRVDGKIVGSGLIGQSFSKPQYFHPRPSAAGNGYDPTQSGGTNLGPTSAKLILGMTSTDSKGKETVTFDGIDDRIVHYCIDNNIAYESSVSLERFKNSQGNLDDVKLIDAFNDSKNPLVFTPKIAIPSDAVTGSASGLDPDISPENAELQLARVAKVRSVRPDQIKSLVAEFTSRPDLGFLGEPRVNVLKLNIALNQHFPAGKSQSAEANTGQKRAVMR